MLFLAACGGGEPSSQETVVSDSLITTDTGQNRVLQLGGRNFSIPSPVQAAFAIRNAGLKYDASLLTDTRKATSMTSRSTRAMALGMLGADMAYVTVHRDGQKALATLQAIERASAQLDLSNAFDKALLERFKNNLSSEDSLLRFSGLAFRAADEYLKNNDRIDISTYVLVGGWIESLHLTIADPAVGQDKALMARVGEQRRALDDLIQLVGDLPSEDQDITVLSGLKALYGTFSGITSTYVYEAPVTEVASRTTFINSKTEVVITPDQIATIAAQVKELRTKILV
jgi:hypothetical protein